MRRSFSHERQPAGPGLACRQETTACLSPRPGVLTFNPGETTKTITITVNGDNRREPDETFCVDLFGNSSNSLFTKNRGIGTILNDD